jgi:hypothetical protein
VGLLLLSPILVRVTQGYFKNDARGEF